MKKMRITIILMLASTTLALRALPATEFHVFGDHPRAGEAQRRPLLCTNHQA